MQVFDLKIAPGAVRFIDVRAAYIYFLNGSAGGGDTTIAFQPESGSETVYLKPGQAYKIPTGDRIGTRWTMTNVKGEGTIIGQVLMGEGEFTDNRVSGSVEVIDGGKARTLAGVAFSAWVSAPGVAGVRSVVQLQNPAASGKNVVVERIAVASQVSTGFEVRPGLADVGGGFGTAASKLVTNGALVVSSAIFKVGTRAVDTTSTLYLLNAAIGTQAAWRPLEPIVIAPGGILSIVGQSLNADVAASMEWYEDKI